MKIGILYPRSNAHPGMMEDFMHGIKKLLNQHDFETRNQLVSESIAFGGNEKEVYEKAEKMLLLEEVDILVAYIDLRILEMIKPLIYSSGKLLLVVNPGANFPQNWIPQPNIIFLTLHHGFLCWLTGNEAAALSETKAISATSFYDCGYLHTASMVKGFAETGGNIMFNYINNQRYDDSFEISQLTDYLSSDKETKILLCVFDSLPASLFYQQLNNYEEASRLYIFASPMMLESEALVKNTGSLKFPVTGHLPWHSSLSGNANDSFKKSYEEQNKPAPSIFSLLGWEVGLILKEVLAIEENDFSDGAVLAQKLARVKIDSPRGELVLDTQTNFFIAPVYRISLNSNSDEPTISNLDNLEKAWRDFVSVPFEGPSSGWTNTYLCY